LSTLLDLVQHLEWRKLTFIARLGPKSSADGFLHEYMFLLGGKVNGPRASDDGGARTYPIASAVDGDKWSKSTGSLT